MSSQQKPPVAEATPKPNPAADSMITLGILTAACATAEPGGKPACEQILEPLKNNKEQAVDTLAHMIVEMGDTGLDDAVDRFNFLMYEATDKAKDIMIKKGVLNRDGSPKTPVTE